MTTSSTGLTLAQDLALLAVLAVLAVLGFSLCAMLGVTNWATAGGGAAAITAINAISLWVRRRWL